MLNILSTRDPAQILGAIISGIAVDVVDLVRGTRRRSVEGATHQAVHPVYFAQDLAVLVAVFARDGRLHDTTCVAEAPDAGDLRPLESERNRCAAEAFAGILHDVAPLLVADDLGGGGLEIKLKDVVSCMCGFAVATRADASRT